MVSPRQVLPIAIDKVVIIVAIAYCEAFKDLFKVPCTDRPQRIGTQS